MKIKYFSCLIMLVMALMTCGSLLANVDCLLKSSSTEQVDISVLTEGGLLRLVILTTMKLD